MTNMLPTPAHLQHRLASIFALAVADCVLLNAGAFAAGHLFAFHGGTMMIGGMIVPYAKLAEQRMEHQNLAGVMKSNLEKILSIGCVIKDLDVGLLDFPAVIDNQEVYLCWKLGEDRIRYYHRQDEGFAGRKPLDPTDLGPGEKLQ